METRFSACEDDLPQDLANYLTLLDIRSFEQLLAFDIVDPEHPLIQDIRTAWNTLCSDVEASVVTDRSLSELFVKTIVRLMALRNYNSTTAILAGLRAAGVNDKGLPYLPLLVPAIYRAVVSKEPGLPFFPPHIDEMDSAHTTLSLPDLSECMQRLHEQRITVGKREIMDKAGMSLNSAVTTGFPTVVLPTDFRTNGTVATDSQPLLGCISARELCPNAIVDLKSNRLNAATPSHAIRTSLPPRPPRPSVFKTAVFKSVGDINIKVDIYMPEIRRASRTPIKLYIHGGGWVGGNRTDCSRLVLTRFLEQGFVVCSMDYRLLPESPFKEMQEDVKDMEPWLRRKLQAEVTEDVSIDNEKIVVVGASSGALLALQTPKLWVDIPTAIIQLYGPTNLQNMPSRGRFSTLDLPHYTDILLSSSFDFVHPPTEKPLPTTEESHDNPRTDKAFSLSLQGGKPSSTPFGRREGRR